MTQDERRFADETWVKSNRRSKDVVDGRAKQIQMLFPEIVVEGDGSIDFDKLRMILGDAVNEGREQYGLMWPGKTDAILQSQRTSKATLRPDQDKSVNWDNTKNLYIEGDNLEVLKLLQRAYHSKIKMIYIDPPYNTEKDWVYADSFSDAVENYKRQARLTEQSAPNRNKVESGRLHSNWLSMMYPRLRLARELLTQDGVIFVSIDDHEARHLRVLCDEIFGENNFIAQFVWERAYSPKNDAKYVSTSHDYIVMYAKDIAEFKIGRLPRTEEANARYINPDNDPRGVWKPGDLSVKTYNAEYDYPITTPSGRVVVPPAGGCWRLSREAFEEKVKDNRIWFGEGGNNMPSIKRFLTELRYDGMVPTTILTHEDVGHSQDGVRQAQKVLGGQNVFDGPKPLGLMERLMVLANLHEDSVVMDFFSGSATMAQAVMEYNAARGTNVSFIMVQIEEQTPEGSKARNAGFATITEIGEERIRAAGKCIAASAEDVTAKERWPFARVVDTGFRVLRLDTSNFEDASGGTLMDNNLKSGRTKDDIIFEIMLQKGIEPSMPLEQREINGYPVTVVAHGDLVCCMDEGLSSETLQTILELRPKSVFVLDTVLTDALKLNAAHAFKQASSTLGYTVELRTV